MSRIDLHTHSNASDGSDSPGEIVKKAVAANLSAVALTDHDTVGGIPEFLDAAKAFPDLEAIPGVEISTVFGNREMHIVGLFLNASNEILTAFLEEMRNNRKIRNEAIRIKLNSLGYPLSYDHPDLAAAGDTASIGRPHFARALMTSYGFSSIQTVFDKLLKRGCPAYVQRVLPDPIRAFEAIHASGGITVWAHPIYRQRNERAWARRIMKRFTPLGLDAVEGFYSLFGPGETQMITELAEIYGLAVSGGSDYHGENSPNIKIGVGAGKLCVPAELLPHLKGISKNKISRSTDLQIQ
ncbi:MAG: PHP domain-containing protein [Victivallales bacterium]|jgi:predicted metal-dependent phosphoesterase TrpH|nr:PHP domain-containing protein [Victivallales bacterium]